jgi:Spy/CpxP family protein refolding chaperone
MNNTHKNRYLAALIALVAAVLGAAIPLWYLLNSSAPDDASNAPKITSITGKLTDLTTQNRRLLAQVSTLKAQLEDRRLEPSAHRVMPPQTAIPAVSGMTTAPPFMDSLFIGSQGEMLLQRLDQLLGLSPVQSAALSALIDSQADVGMDFFDPSSLQPQTREEMAALSEKIRQRTDAINRDYTQQLTDILTPEQLATYRSDEAAKRREMQDFDQQMQQALILKGIDNLDDYQVSEISKLFRSPPTSDASSAEDSILEIVPQMQTIMPINLTSEQQQQLGSLLTQEQYQQFKEY